MRLIDPPAPPADKASESVPRRGAALWRRLAAIGALAGTVLVLAACAAPPPVAPPLLLDARFGPPAEPVEDAAAIFAMSEPMQRYLQERASRWQLPGRQRALVQALYARSELKFSYDASTTRNASQAFEARAGNCLSLALMTAAFAKVLDIPVHYQSASIDETWSRAGSLALRSGHVNVTLGRRPSDLRTLRLEDPLIVDFLPAAELRGLPLREIDEATVIAMYRNNRAAEALARGDLDTAYWWARAAAMADTAFHAPWNTLGLVYRRHGDVDAAERVFREVLARRPRDTDALANLAGLLSQWPGREAEALPLRARMAASESRAPFRDYALGREAADRGDNLEARERFLQELDRSDFAELRYWLAVVESRLGHGERAREQLAMALRASTTARERELYGAKLRKLARVVDGSGDRTP